VGQCVELKPRDGAFSQFYITFLFQQTANGIQYPEAKRKLIIHWVVHGDRIIEPLHIIASGMVQQPFTRNATTWMTAFWLAQREQPKAFNTALQVLNALDSSVLINTNLMEY